MNTNQTAYAMRPRLSLALRVVLLSTLLLLATAALFTWLSYINLTTQFNEMRHEQAEHQQRALNYALLNTEHDLRQLAGLVASSSELGPALIAGDESGVFRALQSQWPSLQLDAGIEEIRVYDTSGELRVSLGQQQQIQPAGIADWVQRVIRHEHPLLLLRCAHSCRQYALIPVLVRGHSVGILMMSRSLADVTRQGRDISTSEVALVTQGNHSEESRYIPGWEASLLAITNQDISLPMLLKAASMASLQDLTAKPLRLTLDKHELEFSATPLITSADSSHDAYFVLMSDITDQINEIRLNTRTQIVASLFGWLSAEILLLAILLRPMTRLRRIASVLLSLATGGYDKAREILSYHPRRLSDEIDVLEGTTLALANQLDILHKELKQRSNELAERVDDLAMERDFIGNLIDTAQVFIITQDSEGRIDMVNAYLETQIGCSAQDLIGRLFDDIFDARDTAWASGPEDNEGPEERILVTSDGSTRTIIWYHSPLTPSDLTCQARLSVGLDITDRKAAEARLTWLAERDPLTELYNRRFFQDALSKALARGDHGVAMMLDLDQFKEVNELSGHHAGDRMLHSVARLLQHEYANRSTIARLGGDEFALLLPGVDCEQAIRMAEHINQLLDSLGFSAEGRRHRVSASIGIVCFPIHGATPADLMASADVAMYKAKASSVQRWHLLSTLQNERDELNERVYWVERIRSALENDDFELMVQPIVRLEDRSIRHYEVLLRMRDEKHDIVMPAQFIPVAEQSGQIVAIDRWVLHHSVRALSRIEGISLAVNLSGQSLHDEQLKRYLSTKLLESGADPHKLILEVTETAAVTDFATARGVLKSMRDLGCRTALDDFGVGFSSFHYLGQLPVDYIKIDGSFIRSLSTNPDSRVIVKAAADISAGFGKQTIAEFVDHETLIPLLASYGIEYGQGFHLGEPTPMKDVFGFDPVSS